MPTVNILTSVPDVAANYSEVELLEHLVADDFFATSIEEPSTPEE